jgi:nucleotide-binding universal stress UspA family protein
MRFRVLIPLDGTDGDTSAAQVAVEMVPRDAEIFLLHMRSGPDEDRYPALAEALSEAERFERRIESERVFARANAILASRGLSSAVEAPAQGKPVKVILSMEMFESALENPEPPVLGVIAGARLEEKLPILENLLPRLNRLFIGGALSFTFLKAKGREIGAARADQALLPLVKDFLLKAERALGVEVILPEDFIAVNVDEFRAYEERRRAGHAPEWRRELENGIPPSYLPVDVGPATINRLKELCEGARTILWNGPLGVWEIKPFGAATRALAILMAERVAPRHQRSILCGDSLALPIGSFKLTVELSERLTTGSESAVQLLAGNPLPAVSALDNVLSFVLPIEARPRRILLPVDGSEYSLEVARRLGRLVDVEGAEILLLHVQMPVDGKTGQERTEPEIKQRREIERRREAELIFGAISMSLAEQRLTAQQQFLAEGDPADEILKFAGEIGADLIAMCSHGRTGVLRSSMGSVSRKVLDQARRPVLIVRIPDHRMVELGSLET